MPDEDSAELEFGRWIRARYEELRARDGFGEAVEALPVREKLVFTLYHDEDQTHGEIGQALYVAYARVTQLHVAALERLGQSLSPHVGDPNLD
jgi:DNA-directed RNA polymerase specialized sigma subunit